MEENEESGTTVRRTTRSKAAKTSPVVKPVRQKPGPLSRRTRKKVVLMEVEVSDEDEDVPKQNKSEDAAEEERKLEEKLLASPEKDTGSADQEMAENLEEAVTHEAVESKNEINGNNRNSEHIETTADDSLTVVINDVDMMEESEIETNTEETAVSSEDSKLLSEEKLELVDTSLNKTEDTKTSTEDDQIKETSSKSFEESSPTDTELIATIATDAEARTANESVDEELTQAKEAEEVLVAKLVETDVDQESDSKSAEVCESDSKPAEVGEIDSKPAEVCEVDSKPAEVSEIDSKPAEVCEIDSKPAEVCEMDSKPAEVCEMDSKPAEVCEVDSKPAEVCEIDSKPTEVCEMDSKPAEVCEIDSKPAEVGEIDSKPAEVCEEDTSHNDKSDDDKQKGDPDAENISEDELPTVQAAKVPEAEEVSDEELPGPKRAELPADTEVVSEDELPTVKSDGKKEGLKRKLDATDYDPGSPTSENEAPTKKLSLEISAEKEKEEKPAKPKKLPELDKYWKAVNDDPTDFTGWTYLLQYVDQENDMEAAREAYDAFLSHYPYCYGYWRKYADYEKRKGNKKKCEEVFERGLKAIPLSVDLWIHYLTYVKSTRADDEEFIRSQFERSIAACGLEFRSDRLWDSFIKWETEGKRLQKVTAIYDKLLSTPTQGYTTHFDNFQEHIASNPPNKVIEVDEFLALRKEVRHMLKHDVTSDSTADMDTDAPPGDDDTSKVISTDEETKAIRERIVSIRRKLHKGTVNAVTARWNYEEGIKRPYFHVKPLERCQLKNWQDYLDYETEQGDRVRIIVLFERCLIACALYEEFWLKFVHYLEGLKNPEMQPKIRDVYERACTIHHLKKPSLHLQWAMFEEDVGNPNRAAEILVNLEKSLPNILQIAYRRINLERRRSDVEKCCQLYEHYINNSKNKMISSNVAIKYSRFCYRVLKDLEKAQEVLKTAITKDPNNPRLYLQLIDLTLQKENVADKEVIEVIDSFLDRESNEMEQKILFAQRKLEFVEDFGSDVQSVQLAYDQYQKVLKQSKDIVKKKEAKTETAASSKKEKTATQSTSQSSTYNYGAYGNSSAQPSYPYSGSQPQGQSYYPQYGQGEQYQYQNWQYPPQGGYGGYNQWGGYGGGYGY